MKRVRAAFQCLPPVEDIAKSQEEEFDIGLLAGKRTACLDDFAQTYIQQFDRIGSVDNPPDLFRESEERYHVRPMTPP